MARVVKKKAPPRSAGKKTPPSSPPSKKKVRIHGRGSLPGERRGGRAKGTPNKNTQRGIQLVEAHVAKGHLHPLEFLLAVGANDRKALGLKKDDPVITMRERSRANRDALPYCLHKLASIELSDSGGKSIMETFAEAVVKLHSAGK